MTGQLTMENSDIMDLEKMLSVGQLWLEAMIDMDIIVA